MPLIFIRDDITRVPCGAIVNAANNSLLGGGGVDGAIHRAAGPGLLAECETLGGCDTGDAKITGAYRLPADHVIHTVGPIWRGGTCGEEALLRSCYRRSLALALGAGCESVAFPLISSGAYGYPKGEALRVAVEEISSFLLENELAVYLVIFDKSSFDIGEKRFGEIESFIDDRYAEEHIDSSRVLTFVRDPGAPQSARYTEDALSAYEALEEPRFSPAPASAAPESSPKEKNAADLREERGAKEKSRFSRLRSALAPAPRESAPMCRPSSAGAAKGSLDEALRSLDESFSEMLLRKIDERGMTDAECYKKANVDRKLFSKIRSDRLYRPSKTTAIAFAIALELPLPEAKDMLMKAGFALSHSSKFDVIIEYFITNRNYNIFEINEALFAFDQALLGA